MIEYLILCTLFLVFIGYREFFIYKERQRLIDRIQASSYIEFKKLDEPPRKKEEKEVKPRNYNWL